jgi:hypothetical protein
MSEKKIIKTYNMKLVFRTFIFHIFCIFVFAFIYLNLSDGFHIIEKDTKSFIDFFLLSTTIQAGVGITNLNPVNYYSKIAVILQQMLMLLTHIVTIYVFTL